MSKRRKIFRSLTAAVLVSASVVGVFGSCTSVRDSNLGENITVASSDAEEAAVILDKKLPDLSLNVVMGTADDGDKYGVDLSGFEDDGYIIKSIDNTVLLFGKTADALYAAANNFVNQYNAGGAIEDMVYHEGSRIEKLTLFGADISEYAIEYAAEQDESLLAVANELQSLINKACGAELPVLSENSGSDRIIRLSFSSDDSLGEKGYRYFEEDGNLVIEGYGVYGCYNGIYRFLENECGWECLSGGNSLLAESGHVDIPDGINKSETPAFNYLYIHDMVWEKFDNERSVNTDRKSKYTHACHGIFNFLDKTSHDKNICYTDEDQYELVKERIIEYIEAQLAAGKTIGKDFTEIDISQLDTGEFCTCENCVKVYAEEGNTFAGPVVRFANRLSEELCEIYPGIMYKIFAYAGTNKPPKTAPNEHIYVTYCFDMNCSNHPLDGSECTGVNFMGRKNSDYAEWFEGWCELTDNIYVWFYSLDTTMQQYTVIDTIYKDFHYLYEHGVKGVFFQSTYHGLGIKPVEHQLVYALNWNMDMTEEEYEALLCRLLEKDYGPGWEYVREYLNVVNKAQDLVGCWQCWGWTELAFWGDKRYDTVFYAENYEYLVELCQKAISMAETKNQVKRCELLAVSMYYKGCYSMYFKAYEENDTETMKLLADRYDIAISYMEKYGFDIDRLVTVDGAVVKVSGNIEDAAWIDWIDAWDDLCPGHTRPMPEKYETQ